MYVTSPPNTSPAKFEQCCKVIIDACQPFPGMSLNPRYSQGKFRGILHGIPVLVKDNMATKDKMQTTAGSWALLGSIVSVPKDYFFPREQSNEMYFANILLIRFVQCFHPCQ